MLMIRSAVRGLAALSRQSIIGRWRRSGKPPIGIETLQTPMQSEFFFVKMINCTCQIYNEPFIVPLFKYAFKLIVNVKYIMNLPLFKYTCALFYCFVFLSHDAIVNCKQDGPSLESSSYLNVSLRYLGPWDLGTPGPWKPLTLGLLDLFPPPIPPHTSPYILLPPPISSSYSPPLV